MNIHQAIKTLQRRADFLAHIIANEMDKPTHFERREIQALQLAIVQMEAIQKQSMDQVEETA